MAEKRKSRRKQDEEKETPTKEEYAVARHLRFNSPVKEGRLAGITVTCFIGCKAVDVLMHSKWSSTENKTNPLFTNRQSCVNYLDRLLVKGLFHRAIRIEKKKSEKTKPKKKIKAGSEEETNLEEEKKSKKDKKSKKEKESDREGEKTDDTEKKKDEKEEKKEEDKKKKEKKLKLGMPDDQRFIDGVCLVFDPVPLKTFIIGLLMVLGAIALCLFPLWPEEVRLGVYYLSLSGAVFLAFILVLFVVRLVLFCLIWMCTLGKHHFWFLPNLNEDVGFIDSFLPLYKHETYSPKPKDSDRKGKGSDKDDIEATKSSGANNSNGENLCSSDSKAITEVTTAEEMARTGINMDEEKAQGEQSGGGGGTESEPSDDQEGFELVDKEDLTEDDDDDDDDDDEDEDEADDDDGDRGQSETKKDK
ncbi:SEC62 [Acanthosepion pharaonis]|uniref:Translocation protein SEC62 n=1 Tax=Acanthosepion pharaonis TaxID=158019 RepID=A0A812CTI3_ACAPH|nr:SEC62 [Sepia pharaonis]